MKYLLLLISMSLAIAGQIFMKKGITASTLSPTLFSVVKTVFSPFVFIGLSSYAISSIFWLFVLQRFSLSVAYPALSITYVIIIILSSIFLKETFTANKMIGSFLIISGVYFIFK